VDLKEYKWGMNIVHEGTIQFMSFYLAYVYIDVMTVSFSRRTVLHGVGWVELDLVGWYYSRLVF
jgi:hypothetical protein